jgi:DNA-binding NarL/FixJ family response regulator
MPEPLPSPEPASAGRSVLLGQRHAALGEGLRDLLSALFEHVVTVADEASLLACAGRLRPTVAVVDLSLGPGAATAWLPRLRETCPDLKLVLLSAYGEPPARELAARAGAVLVLDREIATSLLPAIDRLLAASDSPAPQAPAVPRVGEHPAALLETDAVRPRPP